MIASELHLTFEDVAQMKATSLNAIIRSEGNEHCIARCLKDGRNAFTTKSPNGLRARYRTILYFQEIRFTTSIIFQLKIKDLKTYHVTHWCSDNPTAVRVRCIQSRVVR